MTYYFSCVYYNIISLRKMDLQLLDIFMIYGAFLKLGVF